MGDIWGDTRSLDDGSYERLQDLYRAHIGFTYMGM